MTADTEQWRPITGYEQYEASDHGRIRRAPDAGSAGTRGGHILSQHTDVYAGVLLSLGSGVKRPYRHVHVLVALAWHGPRPDGHEVAHLDDDKTNNRPSNLAYSLPVDNRHHGPIDRDSHGERNPFHKLTDAIVLSLRANPAGHDGLDAARLGVHSCTVQRARRGVSWRHLNTEQASVDRRSLQAQRRKLAATP